MATHGTARASPARVRRPNPRGEDARDPALRTVLDGFRHVVQQLRAYSARAEGETGVTGAQVFVLYALAGAPALSLNELARRTATHQSSVSVVAQRCEAKGLVERRRSAEDGRRVELRLTARGRALLRRIQEPPQARLLRGVASLPTGELAVLASAMRRVTAALEDTSATPTMFFEPTTSKHDHDT